MQKSLAIILLGASSLWLGSGSIPCFAAEVANPGTVAAAAKRPQHSRKKMHKPPQRMIDQPSQREMHRMQKTKSNEKRQRDSREPVQARPEGAPSPSQRGMRRQLKKAKPTPSPATGKP